MRLPYIRSTLVVAALFRLIDSIKAFPLIYILTDGGPGGATEVIGEQLTRLTSQPRSQLGFALVFGVAVSLWSANAGMKALFDALNVVYGEKEQRSFIRLNAISLAFTFGALVFMMSRARC